MRPIGILGGTFDPIHLGHLRLALAAIERLDLLQVRLIPVNIPPHRVMPVAGPEDRKTMVELAIDNQDQLVIDCRELEKGTISYTIDTLRSLRKELVDQSLCLIMGKDAFANLNSWHEWLALVDYAHIIVAKRPGVEEPQVSDIVEQWAKEHVSDDLADIHNNSCGRILFIESPMLNISSTGIRERFARGDSAEDLVPGPVLDFIKQNKLYRNAA